MKQYKQTKIYLLVAGLFLLTIGNSAFATDPDAELEKNGTAALSELGFNPAKFTHRQRQEAQLLKQYQSAWNDHPADQTISYTNPDDIVSRYTDGPGLLYRDMCVPHGVTNKTDLKGYLSILYKKWPRQTWGDGWSNIQLFAGAKPGSWSYYYRFSMYRSLDPAAPAGMTGTGMERVQFDSSGKLISDEVHLIVESGNANCSF